jgi:hypothetical protein
MRGSKNVLIWVHALFDATLQEEMGVKTKDLYKGLNLLRRCGYSEMKSTDRPNNYSTLDTSFFTVAVLSKNGMKKYA